MNSRNLGEPETEYSCAQDRFAIESAFLPSTSKFFGHDPKRERKKWKTLGKFGWKHSSLSETNSDGMIDTLCPEYALMATIELV